METNMKIESFDKAHSGRCPGCGIVDNGQHFGHRFTPRECLHRFHSSEECNDGSYVKYRTSIVARGHKALQKELDNV